MFIREPFEYEERFQREYATDKFGNFADERTSFVLESGDVKKGGAIWLVSFLLLFRLCVRGSIQRNGLVSTLYVIVTRPIYTVESTLRSVCVRWSADDEGGYSLTCCTEVMEQGGLSMAE